MKKLNKVYTALIFLFLYLPMFVLIVASFNTGKDITDFEGFTLSQYAELFRDHKLLPLLGNSLEMALLSSLIATVMGTAAAMGIHRMRPRLRSAILTVTNIPMTNPDIVTGVSLSLLFVFIGALMRNNTILGFWTLLIAHVTFNLPYVILNVMPKLTQMDPALHEAALDLGCTPFQAFRKVTLYEIMPGVISGAIMAFTMSLDDFVISYFVYGPSYVTLPVESFTITRKKPLQPKIYALFTLLFAMILLLMILMNVLQARAERRKNLQHTGRAVTP